MLSYSALLLALLQFFHLTLAAPNPVNGVVSLDTAATDDQFFKAKTTEPAVVPRGTQSLAEPGTPSATVQRRDYHDCIINKDLRANEKDVTNARDAILADRHAYYYLFPNRCQIVLVSGTARIILCGLKDPPPNKTHWDIANAIDYLAEYCTSRKSRKTGGSYIYTDGCAPGDHCPNTQYLVKIEGV